jgi:hypothetical protein
MQSFWLLPSLPLEGRAGEGVVPWSTDGPPPSIPLLKGREGKGHTSPRLGNPLFGIGFEQAYRIVRKACCSVTGLSPSRWR